MAVFDVPEAIAVSRTAMCAGGGLAALTRLQAAGYYLGTLAYYWCDPIMALQNAMQMGWEARARRLLRWGCGRGATIPPRCRPTSAPTPPHRVLATPAVGFLFGAYLYISVNW